MNNGRKNRTQKKIQAQERVEFEINDDVMHTETSHTTNKPEPKFTKK